MQMQYKRKHRLSAALMAGAMCCTMIPAASADEIATPETAEAAAAEATLSLIHICLRQPKRVSALKQRGLFLPTRRSNPPIFYLSEPVSYTHLDVYKRQILNCGIGIPI